jgi:ABC-type amino acid transport system permease subunit
MNKSKEIYKLFSNNSYYAIMIPGLGNYYNIISKQTSIPLCIGIAVFIQMMLSLWSRKKINL